MKILFYILTAAGAVAGMVFSLVANYYGNEQQWEKCAHFWQYAATCWTAVGTAFFVNQFIEKRQEMKQMHNHSRAAYR